VNGVLTGMVRDFTQSATNIIQKAQPKALPKFFVVAVVTANPDSHARLFASSAPHHTDTTTWAFAWLEMVYSSRKNKLFFPQPEKRKGPDNWRSYVFFASKYFLKSGKILSFIVIISDKKDFLL
jgi:hypothetical protein